SVYVEHPLRRLPLHEIVIFNEFVEIFAVNLFLLETPWCTDYYLALSQICNPVIRLVIFLFLYSGQLVKDDNPHYITNYFRLIC
ncbi:hypothetical protein KEM07_28370, partial [Pseudomonas carnis]|uniref:hypothetical protein n=1 Tax=Pseudomonas carnis TaxID=2487355 RepID=UPI001C30ECB5